MKQAENYAATTTQKTFSFFFNISKLTCLAKTAMSSLKESEEQTSPPATPGSLGVHVANSHFSKTSASSGNKGWLQEGKHSLSTSGTPAPQCPLQKMSNQPAYLSAACTDNSELLLQQLKNITQADEDNLTIFLLGGFHTLFLKTSDRFFFLRQNNISGFKMLVVRGCFELEAWVNTHLEYFTPGFGAFEDFRLCVDVHRLVESDISCSAN